MNILPAAPKLLLLISMCWLGVQPLEAQASLGPYEHGSGIKSQGAGGISYAYGEDAIPLVFNPALAATLDDRNDLGVSVFLPTPAGELEGNLLGFDDRYPGDGQTIYPIPQGGMVRRLDERWSFGVSLASAGLGPDYTRNPYQRFGGSPRSSLTFVSSGAALALAWRPQRDHAFGLAINPGYQLLRLQGLQFLDSELPPFGASDTPERTTDRGFDGSFTFGTTLGWHGLILPTVAGGLSYRSKTWTQKHRQYRGLLPDRGSLELPAIWGGGLAWMPTPALTLGVDFQRYEFEHERAFGNRFSNLSEGNFLGSKNGPGFGLKNLDAYKFGLSWLVSPSLTLRAGYIEATPPTRPSETLFNILASVNTGRHYTAGFTWDLEGLEVSAFCAYAPEGRINGENSIPLIYGGGEANTTFGTRSFGLSFGWGFGEHSPID